MPRLPQPLPIDPLLPRILEELRCSSALILQASPGSGKTTRVPPALLGEPWAGGRETWVLVPRRLAAKMAAFRVADERGEDVGQTVGYQFRFEKVSGPKTRLKFLTEGLLLRLLMSDPTLANVAAVVLDEFHERHIHSDVALACLKRLQATERPDLKLIVMSATLETRSLSDYFGGAPVLTLETPVHPVQISYLPRPSTERLEFLVRGAVGQALSTGSGDLLVFLPGMAEIRRCETALLERFKSEIVVIPLHGDLSKEEQGRAFQKFPKPKVILATNIAETSLTFEGVTTVIDGGLHRQASYSWWNGIPTLKTKNVSKASAIQRAGRAGRTGPGRCFRLYTQSDFEGRPAFEVPEIRRSDLAQIVLEIKSLGVASLGEFPWFEPSPTEATAAAVHLLFELGAISTADSDAPITDVGRRMASLPLHPRLSRLILEAARRKVLPEAALLASRISEGDLEDKKAPSESVRRLKEQILSFFPKRPASGSEEDLAFSVLTGFPDRVAQKRKGGRGSEIELVFAAGGSATVNAESLPPGEFFVVLEVRETQRQGSSKSIVRVRSAVPARPDWLLDLSSGLLRETEDLEWDRERRCVRQVSRLKYGALVLSETREAPREAAKATDILLVEGLGIKVDDASLTVAGFLKAVEHLFDPEPTEAALTRLKLLGSVSPDIGGIDLGRFIEKSFEGLTGLEDLTPEGLAQRILATLTPEVQRRIEAQLPTHVVLKGRRVRVHYRWDQKPWIASRLQDFFGMRKGPAILGIKLPLTLHLLAPSQRPVQVTQDLASFWKNAYPQIRKELCRKYPKHKWPEDPLS